MNQRTTFGDGLPEAPIVLASRQGWLDHVEGLRLLLEQAPTGLVVAEAPSGRVVLCNEEARRILGSVTTEAEGAPRCGLEGMIHVDGTPVEPARHPIARALAGEAVRAEMVLYRRREGTVARLSISASPVRSSAGSVLAAISTFIDVTDRYLLETRVRLRLERLVEERSQQASERATELDRLHADLRAISERLEERVRQRTAELVQQARRDPLTGLPGRVAFEERLEHALANAERYARKLALVILDFDGFKAVNDTWGHDVGDRILQETAGRLQASLRRSDTLARYGGDEFVVLVSEIQESDDAREVAEAVLSTVMVPFDVPGDRVALSASVGVSVYPDDARDVGRLRRHADAAMYAAKESGGNAVSVYGSAEAQRLVEPHALTSQ
jgi:diguanylate cyclase (GGDEF)-like protein/PAS domain S-box-containing protein